MPRIATARVTVERMQVSRVPAAELAAAALEATDAAGIEAGRADLIVVAVDRGDGAQVEERIAGALGLSAVDPGQ